MREIRHDIKRWLDDGCSVVLAQVVRTWGSSPRVVGSTMAINDTFCIAGSVSGGCIEGNVVQAAFDSFDRGRGSVEQFHASMERAHEVGLSCGGDIDILLSILDEHLFSIECAEIDAEREYTRVSLVKAPPDVSVGEYFLVTSSEVLSPNKLPILLLPEKCVITSSRKFGNSGIPEDILREAAYFACQQIMQEKTGLIECGDYTFFFSHVSLPLELVCVGGVHIAIHLTQQAKMLGYRTTVIDPRGIFTGEERFPFVDELLEVWPQEAFAKKKLNAATALCALTHDPKIDVPALGAALNSPAFYIGSLGRTTTQLSRYNELIHQGYTDSQISRISGPIGLDIGGREPSEIALSIMAEITMVRHNKQFEMRTMLASAHDAMREKHVV